MEKLEKIARQMDVLPTIMDISDEISIINALMGLSPEEITCNKKIFNKVLEDLYISHTDSGWFELTSENEQVFIEFCQWINYIAQTTKMHIDIEGFDLTYNDLVKFRESVCPVQPYNKHFE
jgi:hypothetical protein